MPDREHRVREIAHRLWEEEGRPSHQDKRHWATAERMVDAEADRDLAREQAPKAAGSSKRPTQRRSAKRTSGTSAGATSH
jgi:Protein of unknown function (DUF2934)